MSAIDPRHRRRVLIIPAEALLAPFPGLPRDARVVEAEPRWGAGGGLAKLDLVVASRAFAAADCREAYPVYRLGEGRP